MEFGAIFILVIFTIVVLVLGGGVYLIAARHRRKQLDPDAAEPAGEARARHITVESEQNTEFVGTH